MRYFIQLAGKEHAVDVVDGGDEKATDGAVVKQVRDEHGSRTVSLSTPVETGLAGAGGSYCVLVDGRVVDLSLSTPAGDGETLDVFGLGSAHAVSIVSERDRSRGPAAGKTAATQRAIIAQMPGRVVQVRVQAGQRVAKGAALLVMEAMKMENELYADESLTVLSVAVKTGDAVEMGAQLLVVEC